MRSTATNSPRRYARGRRSATLVAVALVLLFCGFVILRREQIRVWWTLRRDFESLGRNEQGRAEYVHRDTGIVFVLLPGGTVDIGPTIEEWKTIQRELAVAFLETDEPEEVERYLADPNSLEDLVAMKPGTRTVSVSPFLIAKHELTYQEWYRLVGKDDDIEPDDKRQAVEYVEWNDASNFCERTGLSLPSEEQWEYACRAGSDSVLLDEKTLDAIAWHDDNGRDTEILPHVVGKKRANDFGLHDMLGNVSEWCRGPSAERVLRGGCYESTRAFVSVFSRETVPPEVLMEYSGVGLRPVFLLSD
jgi:formylglycine-generating enzyme required for sulfatase activity